jgi:hypothetical protein
MAEAAKMDKELSRRIVAEALGTGLLVAAVVGSGIMAEKLAGGSDGHEIRLGTHRPDDGEEKPEGRDEFREPLRAGRPSKRRSGNTLARASPCAREPELS